MSDAVTAPAAAPAVAAPAAPVASPAPSPAVAALATAATIPAPEGLVPPGADAKPEDWKAFYRKLGAPEKGEEYKLEVPQGGDAEFAKEAAAQFAEIGLRPDQAKALATWWNTKAGALTEAQKTAATAEQAAEATRRDAAAKVDETALKNEWSAGVGFDGNMNIAKQAVAQFLPKDKAAHAIEALESVLGYGGTMRLFHTLGKGLGEGTARGLGANPGANTGISALEASANAALAAAGIKTKGAA